jgi:hypothetical protein
VSATPLTGIMLDAVPLRPANTAGSVGQSI